MVTGVSPEGGKGKTLSARRGGRRIPAVSLFLVWPAHLSQEYATRDLASKIVKFSYHDHLKFFFHDL
ncbi:unnamed protein product [Spirodela intermedia]|uniref:Uncharacterized protein n=1 Tax=Spirodela intermedia TaxID=51605 RepID=A0A7I8KLH4_SPIIN|nr:unnamed protein product [Spirodela intermedia]